MATIGQRLTAPEAGWKRYDDTHHAFIYVGSWVNNVSTVHFNRSSQIVNTPNNIIKFKFFGSKLRIIGSTLNNRSSNISIIIDGVSETFSEYSPSGSVTGQVLVYEKIELFSGYHDVEIRTNDDLFVTFDAIDIDDTGRLLHPDEVTDIADLDVGKRIRCHYRASSGQVGTFSGLGQETSDFIPPASSATPNGDFYFIVVDKDHLGRWKLIADRNIQHSISWDTLNSEGISSGSGLPLLVNSFQDVIPTMTSNNAPSGIASASSEFSGRPAWKVFDDNSDDNVLYGWLTQEGQTTGWLAYQFSSEKVIGAYSIATHSTTNITYTKRMPKDWTFEGWDGTNWVVLDIRKDITWTDTAKKIFYIEKPGSFIKYRINITANNGDLSYVGFNEMEMFEALSFPPGFKYTIRLLTGGTSSTDKDNEWDQYIVNSTLNGTITAGDNNVWNWYNIYSWTSTTPTISRSNRVCRGYAVSGYRNDVRSQVTTSTTIGFRPVLLIEILKGLPLFSGNVDKTSTHKDTVNLIGTLTIDDGYTVSYQVLVNGQVVHQVNEYLTTHDINVPIPSSNMSIGSNTIRLVAIDNENDSTHWDFSVTVVNDVPVITATMQGLTLNLGINDPESDKVKFRVELNGVQVFPSNGFTNLLDVPISYKRVFKSSEVNIGSMNTVTIYAVDDMGGATSYSITFVGEYAGLMFADIDGNFYSTDLGEVLKYLDFGDVIAGQTTLSVPIRLINKNGFKVTNIMLSNDNSVQPPGARLEMSKSDLPFISEDVLVYSDVLDYGDEITFYVRLATDVGASPRSGKVTIFVKGDPTE